MRNAPDYKVHGLEALRANLNLGYDVAKSTGSRFDTPHSPQAALNTTFKDIGQGATWNSLRRNLLLDFYLNYNQEFASIHSRMDAMAGYSWQHFYQSDFDITKSNPTENGVKEGWTYNGTTKGRPPPSFLRRFMYFLTTTALGCSPWYLLLP